MYNYNEVSADSVEFITVAKIDEVDDGDRLFVEIDDYELVVFNIAGEYFAIGDVCSHDDGPLGEGEIEDYDVTSLLTLCEFQGTILRLGFHWMRSNSAH
jgi:nitrite reductase/ring-hydroxylating ferredoxin subunit